MAPAAEETMVMLEEPLSPKSILYLHGKTSPHIVVTMGLESPIHVDTLRNKLPLTLLKHPRFSSCVVGDVQNKSEDLRWVQIQHVNIDDHIIIPSINPALHDNRLAGDEFVEDYLYNLSKTSLETSKPLWEFHVLNLKTSEAESIAIFRIHHAVGDGASLMSLLLACTRQVANHDALPTIPTSKEKANEKEKNLILVVWLWLQVFWNTVSGVMMILATSIFLKDSDVLPKANLENGGNARRFVHKTVSLEDFKIIKNAMDVTVNDVVLGMIEAGFSKYLFRKFNDKADGKGNSFVKNIRLRMALIFNLRPVAGIQKLVDMMEKGSEVRWGNQIGYVLLPLSMRLPADPLDYVRKAKARVDRKKLSFEAQYTIKVGELAMKLFGPKVAGLISHRASQHSSVIVSNMPGPKEQIGFYGHAIKYMANTGYGLRMPVMITFLSYTNKMSVMLSIDEDADVDARQLCDDIVQSLALFKDAVMEESDYYVQV